MTPAARLDGLDDEQALEALRRCCGATRWARAMLARRPFGTTDHLLAVADAVWATMERADILEAFSHHPRIGANLAELRDKFKSTQTWASSEQAGVKEASDDVLRALQDGNARYLAKFGFLFIVCASGKSAPEMLALLEARIENDPEAELRVAAAEQAKITKIRLEKLT